MSENRKIKYDLIFIVIALCAAAVLYFSGVLSQGDKGAYAVIYIDGRENGRYALDADDSFVVKTDAGENQVVISGGKVSVTDADCPDKLCVKQGEIDRQGETIVCLPHKLVVEIEGGAPPEFDVISK
ncbi:MAG: NusG domain II-containing protein [Firmicutes bacterium]|nr:NusG domain II-containing protein [Bacillota bacterium]